MQYLELKEMKFHAYHGVMAQERKVGNTYTVDLKLAFDFSRAMQTDDLNDTINYAAVYALIDREMAIPSNLIEHLAARILEKIHASFPQIKQLEIRVAKQNPPFGGDVKQAAVVIVQNY
ncbi:MAG: dihydroneopterin aldolase [Candidatus Symbiothrix sp.]|jgi:dihydroneopterin aldolase|nr:dihydroneopterin aldolase [Candidatus Symbiothrix sp.]